MTSTPLSTSSTASGAGPGYAPAGGGGGASKAFLGAAVLLGVLATIIAFVLIQGAAGADRGPKLHIVVAKHDLRANAVIDPERDLQVAEIPRDFADLAAQSLDWEARANYRGQRLNRPIRARQPVFLADLSAVGSLDLAPGARAITIPAEPGIIIPGDYVKVVVPRPDFVAAVQQNPGEGSAGGSRQPNSYQVAIVGRGNGYRVLAVGGSLFKTRQQVTAADQYDSGNLSAKTVTLEVTEDQAAEIMRAVGNSQQKATLLLCVSKESLASADTQPQ